MEEKTVLCLNQNTLEHMKVKARGKECQNFASVSTDVSCNETNASMCQINVQESARARKEYMLRLEMDKAKQVNVVDHDNNDSKLKEIDEQRIQNEDIVKLLNACKKRAVAFHIRDKQLEDKKIKDVKETEYEKMMDIEMEVNRLKDIKAREKHEQEKVKKRIADRKVIEDQIQERKHQKLLQEEARDQ